jgi:small subunit ribosomal protein S13
MLPVLYIFNKPIPRTKNIIYSLTKLFGINKYQSTKICRDLGLNPTIIIDDLKTIQLNEILTKLNKKMKIEEKLKLKKKNHFDELLTIKLTRAVRQTNGLPVRGQRTHTNAKTTKRLNGNKIPNNQIGRKKKAIMKKKNKKK